MGPSGVGDVTQVLSDMFQLPIRFLFWLVAAADVS